MGAIVKRGERNATGTGSSSPWPVIVKRSCCKCLAGAIHLNNSVVAGKQYRHRSSRGTSGTEAVGGCG